MSEELMKEDNNLTMADLEDHFDDANPWNVKMIFQICHC